MSIVHWNPWRELDELFTRVVDRPGEPVARGDWLPAVDISETPTSYRIEVEIPAVPKDNVDVSVKDRVLTVTGERSERTSEEQARRHRVERRWGRFSRSFRLPENADAESIQANARDGVLYLVIAKQEKAQPRRIDVKAA